MLETVPPHVLVVDDEQEIRKLLGRYLGEQGFKVSLAGSKREFAGRVVTERLDIVVLDVLLPDGSGPTSAATSGSARRTFR